MNTKRCGIVRILIVEDDQMIGNGLQKALRADGYAVDWSQNGPDGAEALRAQDYDLVLLDLGLPGMSGIELLQKLRTEKKDTPVLIVSARDTVQDRVAGLDSGADDYLIKPFSLEELEARVRSLLRRREGRRSAVLSAGDITLDTASKTLTYRGKSDILSAKEFAIMNLLMIKPGTILSRSQLEESLYGWNEEIGSNAVEVYVHQLRKKFDKDLIRNVRGLGYMVGGS